MVIRSKGLKKIGTGVMGTGFWNSKLRFELFREAKFYLSIVYVCWVLNSYGLFVVFTWYLFLCSSNQSDC